MRRLFATSVPLPPPPAVKPPERPARSRAAWIAGLAILSLVALKFGYDLTRPNRVSPVPDADEVLPGGKVRTLRDGRASTAAAGAPEAPRIKLDPLPGSEEAPPFTLVGVVRLVGPPPRPQAVLRYEPTGKLCRVFIGDALPGQFRLDDIADDRVVLSDAKGRRHILIGRFEPHYGR